jgi:hypothetical protein
LITGDATTVTKVYYIAFVPWLHAHNLRICDLVSLERAAPDHGEAIYLTMFRNLEIRRAVISVRHMIQSDIAFCYLFLVDSDESDLPRGTRFADSMRVPAKAAKC